MAQGPLAVPPIFSGAWLHCLPGPATRVGRRGACTCRHHYFCPAACMGSGGDGLGPRSPLCVARRLSTGHLWFEEGIISINVAGVAGGAAAEADRLWLRQIWSKFCVVYWSSNFGFAGHVIGGSSCFRRGFLAFCLGRGHCLCVVAWASFYIQSNEPAFLARQASSKKRRLKECCCDTFWCRAALSKACRSSGGCAGEGCERVGDVPGITT